LTVFNNSTHKAIFATGGNLMGLEQAAMSDLILSALKSIGVMDKITIAAVAPAAPVDGDLWLDPSTTPAALKSSAAGSWVAATFANIWPQDYLPLTGGAMSGDVVFGPGVAVTQSAPYTPAALPAASGMLGATVYSTGLSGGGGSFGLVYSDGTNWRKARNGAIVI